MAFVFTCCAQLSHSLQAATQITVYVGPRPYPSYFDPYYDEPKIYRQPRYYTSMSKKNTGRRVFKTTKVKDQYGRTVYKKTTSHKKKRR